MTAIGQRRTPQPPAPDYAAIWRFLRLGLALVAPFWLVVGLIGLLILSGGDPW